MIQMRSGKRFAEQAWSLLAMLILASLVLCSSCSTEAITEPVQLNEIGLTKGQMEAVVQMLPTVINFSYKETARIEAQNEKWDDLMPDLANKIDALGVTEQPTYTIGEAIPLYELKSDGTYLTDTAYYPVFNGDEMVLVYEMFFDYENQLFGTGFDEIRSNLISNLWKTGMKLSLIRDRNACYAYDGETLTYLLRTPEDLELDIMPEDYVKLLDGVELSTVNAVTLPLEQTR